MTLIWFFQYFHSNFIEIFMLDESYCTWFKLFHSHDDWYFFRAEGIAWKWYWNFLIMSLLTKTFEDLKSIIFVSVITLFFAWIISYPEVPVLWLGYGSIKIKLNFWAVSCRHQKVKIMICEATWKITNINGLPDQSRKNFQGLLSKTHSATSCPYSKGSAWRFLTGTRLFTEWCWWHNCAGSNVVLVTSWLWQ